MELFGLKIKNMITFSQRKDFLLFRETKFSRPKIDISLILFGLSLQNLFLKNPTP